MFRMETLAIQYLEKHVSSTNQAQFHKMKNGDEYHLKIQSKDDVCKSNCIPLTCSYVESNKQIDDSILQKEWKEVLEAIDDNSDEAPSFHNYDSPECGWSIWRRIHSYRVPW
jgi:hypothetical protein